MLFKRTCRPRLRIFKGKLLGFLLWLYVLLLLVSITLACFFSYQQRYNELTSQIDNVYSQLSNEYRDITDNFWQLYMPFFDSSTNFRTILQNYITTDSSVPLTPLERLDLERVLKQMLLRNHNVKWIAIYSNSRDDNYILYSDSSGLRQLPEDFPYLEELQSDSAKMEIYGTKTGSTRNTFAICGGFPYFTGSGKILVGYSTEPFQSICKNTAFQLDSLSYVLTSNDSVLFDYHGAEPLQIENLSEVTNPDYLRTQAGEWLHTYTQSCGTKSSHLTYYASRWEILIHCHSNTPLLISLFLMFALISFVGYCYILRMMRKEVAIIQDGLNKISENNLEYRISKRFQQDELSEIALSINQMAERLNHNIHLAYYYEIKQREAELSELQSKFNPHFLYNTLEMLRSRCQSNGDDTSADLVSDMASIFRGLISPKNFIPLTEELAFSKRYLSLFSARYGDSVKVQYDFEKELLSYGIIKNVFQPLIENYFVHGFDTSQKDNYILLKGQSLDEKTMLLTIEDNGIGMAPEAMAELNEKLHEPIQISTESYGLKNLHQRLVLFYGDICGLAIYPNPNAPSGLSIQITAAKITCEEHEALRRNQQKAENGKV